MVLLTQDRPFSTEFSSTTREQLDSIEGTLHYITILYMHYCPSVRSRWLDISQVLFFLRFYESRRSRGP